MKRTGPPYDGIRAWAMCMVGLILLGAGWLTVRLVVAEHDVAAAISVVLLAVAIVVGNSRAARSAGDPGRPRMVREGHLWVPEDRFGTRRRPVVRLAEDVEPPRPKLGAPGSLN